MIRTFVLAASVAAMMALVPKADIASAAPVGPHTPLAGPEASSPIVQVQYGVCRGWARTCAARWGWGTWRFRRCMRFHGC